jgi:hypothetical protein
MLHLNRDVFLLIFEELKNDRNSLFSCLFVDRNWCEMVVPILWRNPWTRQEGQKYITLFNVILSHLSEESRHNLNNQGINLITETYQRPLFNYIYFWKYLEISFLESIISSKQVEKSEKFIIKSEIFKIFINSNTKFIHLSIPYAYDYQLLHNPGVECCFSELESFHCYTKVDQNILEGLAKICKTIKKLRVRVCTDESVGVIKLIEAQINLNHVSFSGMLNESFHKSLEESLIKHADTIQYLKIGWAPITKFLSYLTNLLRFEIYYIDFIKWNNLNYFENFSLPVLKTLKLVQVPTKILTNLIENTKETLSEINVCYDSVVIIQAIYQNCPNLKYLKLTLIANFNTLISEFESLLANCQLLDGLILEIDEDINNEFKWDEFFLILAKSSPINLFKFKFNFYNTIKLNDIKLFFDNWKDRNFILLSVGYSNYCNMHLRQQLQELIENYKAKGIVKKYSIKYCSYSFDDDFEWTTFE